MKLLKSKFKPLVLVALLSMIGSVQAAPAAPAAFSDVTITQDTATNLDVSWNFNLLGVGVAPWGSSFAAGSTLTNWTLDLFGSKNSATSLNPLYTLGVAAGAGQFVAVGDEYATGWTKKNGLFSLTETATIGDRVYSVAITSDGASKVWHGHLTGVAPIPEPGEWALMLSGLGLIGFMVRRRTADVA